MVCWLLSVRVGTPGEGGAPPGQGRAAHQDRRSNLVFLKVLDTQQEPRAPFSFKM